MIHVWMFIVCLISMPAYAEFKHIKISPQFEQYLNQPNLKSTHASSFKHKIKAGLLGANEKEIVSPFPNDGEQSPLFEEIRNYLEASHEDIGLREVANLDFLNRQFNMGTENFSGFNWQKPFGVVGVMVNRQVAPNLFGSNWLVQDTFTIEIEATTFLERTNEVGITEMTPTEIGAYGGITFKRIYTYYHYADSFKAGLKANFSKLFLPFLKMNIAGIEKMGHEEIMKREDNWTLSAGGIIESPAYYGFSFTGGMMGKLAYQNLVAVQNLQDEASLEKIRISNKGTRSVSAGVSVGLQLDLFKLIKTTLLSYDLNYEYASSKEFTLELDQTDMQLVQNDQTQKAELRHVLQGVGKVKTLEPFVVELDEDESSELSQRGSLLILGKLAKAKTEQVRVIKNNQVKVFFKTYAQSVKVVQNIFSRLFATVVYQLLKLPFGAKNAAVRTHQMTLEYEATHAQSGDTNVARIDDVEQFSFVLNQSYEAAKTDRWADKKFKKNVIKFAADFTTLPSNIQQLIQDENLKGPMLIETNIRVEKTGFKHFLALPENTVMEQITIACESAIVRFNCLNSLEKSYLAFKADYAANFLKPSIAKFKKFIAKYFKHTQNLAGLTALFGGSNTFIHGQLKATTPSRSQFVTTFSAGQFRGLGVIDNYKRTDGLRQPASIVSE